MAIGQNNSESPILSICQKRFYTWSKDHAGAGDCGVGIIFHDLPSFALRALTA